MKGKSYYFWKCPTSMCKGRSKKKSKKKVPKCKNCAAPMVLT